MIYFDSHMRDRILHRFAALLADGGYLCLGHSESIQSHEHGLRLVGRSIYQKTGARAHVG